VYRNFGFMFNWVGRCVFFILTGTLVFAFGTLGIIAGLVTVVNVIFNIYVLRNNDEYREHMEQEAIEMRERAKTNPPPKSGTKAAPEEAAPPKNYKSAWDEEEGKATSTPAAAEVVISVDSNSDKLTKKELKALEKEKKEREKREKEAEKQRQKEMKSQLKADKDTEKVVESDKPDVWEEKPAAVLGAVAVLKLASGEWQKFADPKSGTFYYFNSATNETRWEEPKS